MRGSRSRRLHLSCSSCKGPSQPTPQAPVAVGTAVLQVQKQLLLLLLQLSLPVNQEGLKHPPVEVLLCDVTQGHHEQALQIAGILYHRLPVRRIH